MSRPGCVTVHCLTPHSDGKRVCLLTNLLLAVALSSKIHSSHLCLCISMAQIMQHHGCRSHIRDRNKLTGLEERFDLVVDSNDVILERAVRPARSVFYKFCHVHVFASQPRCCI